MLGQQRKKERILKKKSNLLLMFYKLITGNGNRRGWGHGPVGQNILCEHENLSLNPQHLKGMAEHSCNPRPGAYWPDT